MVLITHFVFYVKFFQKDCKDTFSASLNNMEKGDILNGSLIFLRMSK